MMDDDGAGEIFRHQHQIVNEVDIDTFGLQQLEKLNLILQIGTNGIVKGKSRRSVALFE